MKKEEIQRIHKQVIETPSYLKDLQQWQLEELFKFSASIVSKKRTKIKKLIEDQPDTTWDFWENESLIGRDIKREQGLQKIIKSAIQSIKKGESISLDAPVGITMYGSPSKDWYDEIEHISNRSKEKNLSIDIDHKAIELFCHDDFGLQMYQRIKAIFSNNREGAYLGLKIVTYLAETSAIFEDQPLKVIRFVKSYLSNEISFKPEISNKLKICLTDILKKRVEDKSAGMKLIVEELNNIDFYNHDESFNTDLSASTDSKFKNIRTEFFGVDYIDVEMWVKGTAIAYGLSETKENKVEKFLNKYSDEVKRQLKENHDFIESLSKQTLKSESNSSHHYINWRIGDDTLEQFIEALKEHNLIKARETEAIIKDHFKPVKGKNREPKPIKWIYPYKNLLAYLIRELHNNRFIEENIWQETEPHFSIDGEIVEGLRKSEDQYVHRSKTGKPSSHEIVDNIIDNLSN